MMRQTVRECYGFPVSCSVEPAALPVVDSFFGPELADRPDQPAPTSPTVRLTVTVHDSAATAVDPPHTVEVIRADPITIDTGSSRAVLDPPSWTATLSLARKDLDDPIVWGRWILERLFLYLVCRSDGHYPLHAGAVAIDGRVALVSAPTGIGKSTFTWWAAHRGATLLGEDIMVRNLADPTVRFWGYPRAVYLSADLLARSPELHGAVRAGVNGGEKFRVTIPAGLANQVRSAAEPDCLVFLARGTPGGAAGIRTLDPAEAVERCREDFSTAKTDPAVLEQVAADLHKSLADLPVLELTLADGLASLDASYRLLRSTLRHR